MDKTQIFIEKAQKVHGNLYTYDKVEYIDSKTKLVITCSVHGDFEQTSNIHLRGSGCKQCNPTTGKKKSNLKEFIQNSKVLYGNQYNYSLVRYKGDHIKVLLIHSERGIIEITPHEHLNSSNNID